MPDIKTDAEKKARDNLNKLLFELPPYCKTFINAKAASKAIRTLYAYATDLHTFFYYIIKNNPQYTDKGISSVSFDTLKNITTHDIEEYVSFVKYYEVDDVIDKAGYKKARHNGDDGIRRKIATLSAFFNYFYHLNELPGNPVQKFELPVRKDKDIVILEKDETSALLNGLRDQSIWTDAELKYHKKTKYRDLAIYTLLLSSGIRISEAMGLNMSDLDFDHRQFRVLRKGNKQQIIGMSETVSEILSEYIEYERPNLIRTDKEPALFLSLKKTRLSPRQVESMTHTINLKLFPMKRVTPHTMRKSFGSSLQAEYGDIYLTASALGHSDINTTRKHYAKQDQDRVTDVFRSHNIE